MCTVLVPLAEDCEELEAVTIIDLLRRANIHVTVASLSENKVVKASRGVVLVADMRLSEVLDNNYDLIVLPGGLPGANYLAEDSRIITLLQKQIQKQARVAAICAAPKVLLKAGLLNERSATAYPGVFTSLDTTGVETKDDAVIIDGLITTSRGPGTAIDFALNLIAQLKGDKKSHEIEEQLVR